MSHAPGVIAKKLDVDGTSPCVSASQIDAILIQIMSCVARGTRRRGYKKLLHSGFKAKIYEISSDTHQLQFIKLHHFKQERFFTSSDFLVIN